MAVFQVRRQVKSDAVFPSKDNESFRGLGIPTEVHPTEMVFVVVEESPEVASHSEVQVVLEERISFDLLRSVLPNTKSPILSPIIEKLFMKPLQWMRMNGS